MNAPEIPPLRLTQFSHGGGCGCKIAPGLLRDIIAKTGVAMIPKDLMVGNEVVLGSAIADAERALLMDPQTSGGLLVACAPEAAGEVLAVFGSEGFEHVAVIGEIVAGPAEVTAR